MTTNDFKDQINKVIESNLPQAVAHQYKMFITNAEALTVENTNLKSKVTKLNAENEELKLTIDGLTKQLNECLEIKNRELDIENRERNIQIELLNLKLEERNNSHNEILKLVDKVFSIPSVTVSNSKTNTGPVTDSEQTTTMVSK